MFIDSIETNDGQNVELSELNVLFGPNNVGKTQTLKDILSIISNANASNDSIIVEGLNYEHPSDLSNTYDNLSIDREDNMGRYVIKELPPTITGDYSGYISNHYYDQLQNHDIDNINSLIEIIGGSKVFYLGAESRLTAASQATHQDVEDAPKSLIQHVHNDVTGQRMSRLRDAFDYVFGKDIALDYSGEKLRFYVSDHFGDLPHHPIERHDVLKQERRLDDEGGGYRSFAGVVLSLLVSDDRVVLIDEPRAFLHPAQSRKMGGWIAQNIDELPGQIIVATHDANFISGLLAGNQDLSMHRLSRDENRTTFTSISPNLTSDLASDPVLSSQPVLDSLFHQGVVIGEGDEDRSIYRSVLLREFGKDEFLFIHTYGKGKMSDVVDAMTESQVPSAAVVDMTYSKIQVNSKAY